MKPRIAIFGLPMRQHAHVRVSVFTNPANGSYGNLALDENNDDSGLLLGQLSEDLEIDSTYTVVIQCLGIEYYSHQAKYLGGDISHVPTLQRDRNIDEQSVAKDWDLKVWEKWNPRQDHDLGAAREKQFILSKKISVLPIWESYFREGGIDYFEKFHKLWVGLNAFATHSTTESQDGAKVFALVGTELKDRFRAVVLEASQAASKQKWREFQRATGVNHTSDIVRDELAKSCPYFDFLAAAKKSAAQIEGLHQLCDGLVFLGGSSSVFRELFQGYHTFMASEEGIVHPFNLSDAFVPPKAPSSLERYGRLLFDNPLVAIEDGTLFSIDDVFGPAYAKNRYPGQSENARFEQADPLFFRYLIMLYKFRCAYFHGDLLPTAANNMLAKAAYESLYDLMSVAVGNVQ